MSHGYRAVGWNRQKRRYDGLVWLGIALYIGVFAVVAGTRQPPPTAETVLIRAFGTCALVLLHVILSIGPLCRLNPRWLPLLYNRRHLGVSMFLVALVHAAAAFVQFHALGVLNPFVSLLVSDGRWLDGGYPFQPLGLIALIILFGMAATSHDFWLANLSPPIWKTLHMAVYVAYGLIVLHVGLGLLQTARTGPLVALLGAGMAWVLGLHLAAGWRERAADVAREANAGRDRDDYVDCGPASTLADGAARVVSLGGERVAVFRYGDRVSAVSNVCRHQNGPLGEGRIIDGLITCPWHGYQYRPDDGCSPPPFDERVPTFRVRVADGRVWVHPAALPAGTRVEPARIVPGPGPAPAPAGGAVHRTPADAFYVGYAPRSAPTVRRFVRRRVVALIGGGACIAAAVAAALPPNAPSHFFYGEVRTYTGRLDLAPVPMLTIAPLPGEPDVDPRLILVGEGKHGIDRRALAPLDHRIVRLRGTPAFLGTNGLIEVVGGSVEAADGQVGPPEAARVPSSIAGGTLLGEITEGKCALGVMNPGWGVVHRACASLCLRGGIPPLFIGR
ncbi:MAG: Rieske 2Fe-2S domain-containing protein, partial [Ardenticatenales bacterium]